MIKELGTYTINGKPAVFNALVEKKSFKTYPVALFTFADGSRIKCTHDMMTGVTTYSGDMDPKVDYHGGLWSFI